MDRSHSTFAIETKGLTRNFGALMRRADTDKASSTVQTGWGRHVE